MPSSGWLLLIANHGITNSDQSHPLSGSKSFQLWSGFLLKKSQGFCATLRPCFGRVAQSSVLWNACQLSLASSWWSWSCHPALCYTAWGSSRIGKFQWHPQLYGLLVCLLPGSTQMKLSSVALGLAWALKTCCFSFSGAIGYPKLSQETCFWCTECYCQTPSPQRASLGFLPGHAL